MSSIIIAWTTIKQNRNMVLLMAIIWGLLIVFTVALFDTLKAQAPSLEAALGAFPEEFLEAFGASTDTLTTIPGYLNAQVFSLLLLANTILAGYFGAAAIGKEIANNAITLLVSRPISRLNIYLSRFAAYTIVLFAITALIFAITFVSVILFTKEDPQLRFFLVMFIGSMLMQVFFLAAGQLLGTVLSDGVAIALVATFSIVSLVLNGIARLDGVPEFVRFLTPYEYMDTTYIARESAFKFMSDPWVFVFLTTILVVAGAWWFRRKDLNV
jgi:ABC-2 type transport system permease protein